MRDDRVLFLDHGKPLVFGKNKNQGIRQNGFDIEVVTLREGASEADLLVHNEQDPSPAYAYMLASMDSRPGFPTPVGVLRAVDAPIYEDGVNEQVKQIIAKKGRGVASAASPTQPKTPAVLRGPIPLARARSNP